MSPIIIFPRLSLRSSISRTIRMYDMPTMRIRRYWPGESRLGRLAMDLASSVSVPLSAVPPEISRLVLESLMPPAPSRRSTVGRRSVDESTFLVPPEGFSVYGYRVLRPSERRATSAKNIGNRHREQGLQSETTNETMLESHHPSGMG